MANQIKFDINFDVDKSGLSEIQQSLQAIQNMAASDLMKLDKNMDITQADDQLGKVKETAKQVGTMLQNSFNQDLGTLNISKFNEQLKGLDLNKVYNQFASIGTTGQTAFRRITTQILTTNTQLKESHALLDSMATTMANTVKWGVASSAMNKLTGSVQEAYGYVKSLDTSLNNIRIVTEKSNEEMAAFAKNANDAAKALGTSTTDYTNASLIYYQQGLSDEEAAARTEVTLKTANVTGQAAEEVSEQLTAVWNGYQVTSEQAEASIDTLAAVAANTASNLEELSTGMSKVASAANAMGVGEEQLAAQLSTIISATRQAPESVGTALRTVYARMSTIATGGVDDDDGATLTSYTKKMENFGISVLDINGELRDMGDVIEEVGGKWDTFTREQQISLAQTMAGTRQYNYVLALFENWDEYTRALNIAENAVGTLQDQQDTYMESTAAHLEQMNASFEDLYDSLLGTDAINAIVDVISGAASAMATFIDSIGGGSGALLALGSVGVSVFSTQIANGIATTITNLQKAKDNTAQLQAEMEILQQYRNAGIDDEQIRQLVETKQAFVDLDDYMSESDRQQSNALIQQKEYLMEQKDLWDAQVDQAQTYVDTLEEAPEVPKDGLESMNSKERQKTIDAIKDERVELQKALDSTEDQYKAIDDYQQKTNALTDATNELTRSEQAEQSQKEQVTQATAAQETSYNELRDQIKEITNEVNSSSEKFKQQNEAYNQYQAALGEYNKAIEKSTKGTEFAQAAEGVVKAYENMNKAAMDAGKQAEGVLHDMANEAGSTGDKIQEKTAETDGKITAFFKKINLTKQITEFENFISAIGKTASAMNTLNNIFDVWRNQDLSTTEKLTQIFTGLAMAIPMAVSGIQDLATAISGVLGVSTGGVAAVLTGLLVAITAVTQIASSYTTELERASNTAEALAQANDDIAQSLTNIKSNIDAYDDAVDTLEDCVQGTEEWKSALEDVNDAAVDVINSLSGLSGDDIRALYSRDTNGNIQLDREALNGYVDRQQSLASSTELASGYGEYQASMAQISSDYKDLSGTVSRLALDLSTSEEEASDALLKLQTDADFQELSDQTTFTADDLKSLRSKLLDMAEAADAAQAKLQLISDLEISEAVGDQYGEDSAVIQQMVSNGVTAGIKTEAEGIADGIRSLARWTGSNNQTYQDVLKALNNAGYNYTAAGNAVQGSGSGNRTLSFYDENGELVTQSAEYWANIVAAADQMSDLETSADEAAAALQNLSDKAGEDIAGGIADYIVNGNLEGLTESQKDQLSNDIGYSETGDMESAVASYLKDVGMSDYIDASDFLAAFEDINTGFDHVADNLRQTASDAFETLADTHAFDDLSLRAQKTVADMLENSLDYGGETAMTAVANILGSLGDGLSDFIGVADQFSDSWGDVSYESFLLALQQSGYESEISADDLYTFIAAMNATGAATRKSEDAIRESYKAVQDITSGLGYRDTITQEDYDTLIQEGITGLNKYFRLMSDGTYMLTTSAEKFADEIQRQQFDKIHNEEQQNNQTISSLQNAQDTVGKQSFSDFTQSAATETGIDTALVTKQISLLQDLSAVQADVIGQWEDQIETGEATAETYQEIADAVANCEDDYNNIDQTVEELQATNLQWEIGLMETADSLSELQQMLESGLLGDLEESEEAMAAYNTVAAELAEASRIEGLDSDEIKDYSKYLQNLAKESDELAKSLENDDDAAYDLAVQIMRMNNGVETLADNWDDWSDVLKKSSKESKEYYDALENTRAAMSDLLDTDSAFISDDTIIDHMDDIALAAQGDADAIDRLREAAYEDILVKFGIDDTALYEGMTYSLSDIQAFLDDNLLEVGASIQDIGSDADDFIASLNALIDATQMTSDQVQAMLSDMGYNVTFEEGEDEATTMIPTTHTTHTVNILDWAQVTGPSGEVYDIPQWETVESAVTQYEPATEEMESIAAQIDTEGGSTGGGGVTSAHVANITKKASGAANNYSSANSGGKSLGSSGSGSGGSGGGNKGSGSGSSSEPAEPAHEDYIESQADRYHDVDLRLKEISNTLSRLQKQEDKLYGQALLDNLNDQLSTLDSQLDATNDKLAIAQEESAEYRKTLSSQGVKFDENGYITNYDKVMEKQLAYVNSVIDKYNSMSAEEQEAYQDTLDKAKEDYDAFVELISNYESVTFDSIPELSDSITDALNQEIEIQIKKFTMEVEIRLDMTEAEQSWNEFYRKVVLGVSDDDALGQAMQSFADILSYYNTGATDIVDGSVTTLEGWWDQIVSSIGGGTGSIQAGTNQVNSLLEEYNKMKETGWSDVYGDNESQLLSDLQTAYTELMTELEAIEDLQDSIMDAYLDKIDEAIDAFDEQVSQYEFINDLLNHDMNLIGLLYGDDAYEEMSRYYKQIEENNNQELDFLRKRVDYAYEMMTTESDPEARKKWQEEWENALSELNDKVEDAVQNIIDEYSNAVAQIIDELNKKVTNGLGLDYVSEEWDLMNQVSDMYLDTINAEYSIQSLENKYNQAINSTDSITAQKKLNDVMAEQVDYLREKENLTQYDVDRANMVYEITLKQLALEEAQQNKSTLRLRRDAQGNYTYQYVADEDEIQTLQQELADLENQLYNLDKQAYVNNLDQILAIYTEFQEKVLELYQDQTLSAEEREAKIAMYVDEYGKLANGYVEENGYIREKLTESTIANLASLYGVDVTNFKNMTDEELDNLMNTLVPNWDNSVQGMADTFAGEGGMVEVCSDALDSLDDATDAYDQSLDDLQKAAGICFDEIAEGYDDDAEAARDLTEDNDDLIDSYDDEIKEIQKVVSALGNLADAYDDVKTAAIGAVSAGYSTSQEAAAAAAEAAAQEQKAQETKEDTGGKSGSDTGGKSGSGSGSGSSTDFSVGDAVKLKDGKLYYEDSNGKGKSGSLYAGTGTKLYVTKIASSGTHPYHLSTQNKAPTNPADSSQVGWVKKSSIEKYATGGYTGDWNGDEGELAVLHQKELVLNRDDTKNLLSAVGIVRDVATMLDSLNTSVLNKVSNLITNLSQVKLQHDKENKVLEQDVHIEANFPNVTNSNEIENAFNNLVNIASMHAYSTH